MSTNSFFNQQSIQKIKKIHKGFLWVATGVLIASLLLGIILIFINTDSDAFGKVQGTFSILALAAFICVNNFIRIEKGNKLIQSFALTGLCANVVWLIMGVLMIWGVLLPVQNNYSGVKTENATIRTYDYKNALDEVDDYDDYDDYDDFDDYDEYDDYDDYDSDYDYDYNYDYDYDYDDYDTVDTYRNVVTPSSFTPSSLSITIAARIVIIAISVASIGFWVSNILAIKERVKAVIPLKITAIVCQVFSSVFAIVLACVWPITIDANILKWVELYGLVVSGFIVMALAAWIISITHKNFEVVSIKEEPQEKKLVADIDDGKDVPSETELKTESEKVEKLAPVEEEKAKSDDGEPAAESSVEIEEHAIKVELSNKPEEDEEEKKDVEHSDETKEGEEEKEDVGHSDETEESKENSMGFEGFSENN